MPVAKEQKEFSPSNTGSSATEEAVSPGDKRAKKALDERAAMLRAFRHSDPNMGRYIDDER
jgi:hypothetical protein